MRTAALKLLKAVIHFENWPARLLEMMHLLPRRLSLYRIRGGAVFAVRPYTSDAACVQSITRDGEYFRYFNVMPGDTVVDVGANIGSFAVSVAEREPTARVIAVEPMEANVELLKKNIELNRLTNVEVLRSGISDESGSLTFYHVNGSWLASGSLYRIDAVSADRSETAPALTIGELFRRHNITRCDFLKMDCEGAEYRILWNCPDEVWKRISKLALEFHNFEPGKTPQDILSLLARKGFRAVMPKKYAGKEIGLIFAVREGTPAA